MATTSLNPGVGPTNADIATAVAAPSAATIAAAVAAPSAATIAAAVAAPSSATIASAVAAAVPTTAGITSIVQANAGSPYAGSWSYLGKLAPTSGSSVSYTGLSSYKYLKLMWVGAQTSGGGNFRMRFNSDTSTNYNQFHYGLTAYSPATLQVDQSNNQTLFDFFATDGGRNYGVIEITKSNNASMPRHISGETTWYNGTYQTTVKYNGLYGGTSAIDSIQLFPSSGTFAFGGNNGIHLWGGN